MATPRPASRWLDQPRNVIGLVGVGSVVGYVLTGWLAGLTSIGPVGVRWIQQDDALLFLAAWAQIVLAIAVWFQVKTARDSAGHQTTQIEQVDKELVILRDQVAQGQRQL